MKESPEPKAESAAPEQPEVQASSQPKVKPEPKPEPKAEAKPEPKPETKAEAKPEPKSKPLSEAAQLAPEQDPLENMPPLTIQSANPPTADSYPGDTGKLTIEASKEEANRVMATDIATGEPVPMPEVPAEMANGNVVRFEIFLSPEQLSCLFRALVSTQHSMLTLREAAHYLRIPATTLEQLAVEGKIPALQLEGRWRFPKSGMDEWVMLQSFREGEMSDAA